MKLKRLNDLFNKISTESPRDEENEAAKGKRRKRKQKGGKKYRG